MQETFIHLVATYGYAMLFALVALESLGIPLPGETALITAAAMAAQGHLSIVGVIVTATAAAIIGDNGGYWIGRKGGLAVARRYGPLVRFNEAKLNSLRDFFARHGGKTVFIGRFIALLRTWAAFFAGTSGMAYAEFMAYNALGGLVWAGLFGTLGYVFGRNLPKLEHYIGRVSIALLIGALIAGLVFLQRRRRAAH